MPARLAPLTKEDLETKDWVPCVVYRAFLAAGPSKILDVASIERRGPWTTAIARLIRDGWMRKVGRVGRFTVYEALREQLPPEHLPQPTAGMRRSATDERLLKVIRKARAARKSALASRMGQALFEIEKDLQEARGSL